MKEMDYNYEWKYIECNHKFILNDTNDVCPKCKSTDTFPINSTTALKCITIPKFDIKIKSRVALKKWDINEYLVENTHTVKERNDKNRFIGALGEAEAALFFLSKGFDVTDHFPIDLMIKKNNIICYIDVKTTIKDNWKPKKYFFNKESQLKSFGFSIDEYLRLKLLVNPYRVIFNEPDIKTIQNYFI